MKYYAGLDVSVKETSAGAGRGHGQQMGGAVIAERLAGFAVAADQEAGASAGQRGHFLDGGEASRAEPWVSPSMFPKCRIIGLVMKRNTSQRTIRRTMT